MPTHLIRRRREAAIGLILLFGLGAMPIQSVHAQTADLQFSPQATAVGINDVIEIELRVFAPNADSPTLSYVEALINWDPSHLELLQVDPPGCASPSFFACGFLTNPDGLNDGSGAPNLPNNDGDALYTALTNPAPPTIIPAAPGLLVTTFRFRALTETAGTDVYLVDMLSGGISRTRVYAPGNIDLTGDISGALTTVTICGATPDSDGDGVADACDICPGSNDLSDLDEDGLPNGCDPCPLTATPGVTQGDVDGNGSAELADLPLFINVLLGLDTDPMHVAASDTNCDGTVDGLDIQGEVAILL